MHSKSKPGFIRLNTLALAAALALACTLALLFCGCQSKAEREKLAEEGLLYYKNLDDDIIDFVIDNLNDINKLCDNIYEIQSKINLAREMSEFSDYDYAVSEKWLWNNRKSHLNELFSGERYFMYRMFYDIYNSSDNFDSAWKSIVETHNLKISAP